MALVAQQYYEDPATIPLGRSRAAEFISPVAPVDDEGEAPLYREIVQLRARQFLRFRAWLGRRSMLYPDRIDDASVLADVEAAIEEYGTATVTIFDDSTNGHQLLAYGVDERANGADLLAYDPNYPARRYGEGHRRLQFDRDGDGYEMRSYGQFDHVLFNRFDRISTATGRSASPIDHLTVDSQAVLASLFPAIVVSVDSPDVDLAVAGPDGRRLRRLTAPLMDRTRGAISRIRSRFGGPTGEYRIAVTADADVDYDLELRAADPDGERLDVVRSGELAAGDTNRYVANVPKEGVGTVERVENERSSWPMLAAGLAGAVAGSAVYGAVRRQGDR